MSIVNSNNLKIKQSIDFHINNEKDGQIAKNIFQKACAQYKQNIVPIDSKDKRTVDHIAQDIAYDIIYFSDDFDDDFNELESAVSKKHTFDNGPSDQILEKLDEIRFAIFSGVQDFIANSIRKDLQQ